MSRRRFKFVVNPEAGRGKSRKAAAAIDSLMKSKGATYDIQETSRRHEATEIARESASAYDVVVAVGGDGTANEVANGVIGTRAALGVIPTGSGNDFAMLLGMKNSLDECVQQVVSVRTAKIDTGTVRLTDKSRGTVSRKFVNSIGIGFDAVVAYESQRIKRLKGIPLYLLSVFKSLKSHRPYRFELTFDGHSEEPANYYLVCVGNGNREGGGFYVTPKAHPGDGIFDVCTVKHVPIGRALKILPTVFKGAHGKFSEVRFLRSQRIKVGCERPFVVHCDGEILGTENEEAEMELEAGSLEVVVDENGLQIST